MIGLTMPNDHGFFVFDCFGNHLTVRNALRGLVFKKNGLDRITKFLSKKIGNFDQLKSFIATDYVVIIQISTTLGRKHKMLKYLSMSFVF